MGRFLSLDPLAADYASWSAYNYVLGNPIIFIDPDGRSTRTAEQNETEEKEEMSGWTVNNAKLATGWFQGAGTDDAFSQYEQKDSKYPPTPEELSDRFGDSFKSTYLPELFSQFPNPNNDPADIEAIAAHATSFDFRGLLEDTEGNQRLELKRIDVQGFTINPDGSIGSSVHRANYSIGFGPTMEWGEDGMTINPGVYYPGGNKSRGGTNNIYTDPIEIPTSDGGIISIVVWLETVPHM